jgi:hypothetical protein
VQRAQCGEIRASGGRHNGRWLGTGKIGMTYSAFYLIRTRQAVYVELLVTFSLTLLMLAIDFAGSNEGWMYLAEFTALLLPVTLTIKLLQHLGEQEKLVHEPDANMRLLFLTAILTPILGYMPIVVFL